MSLSLKKSGAWAAAPPQIRQSGAWKPVVTGWIKQAGAWVPVYSAGPQPGDVYGGGYYVGTIAFSGQNYALVVAPKAAETVSTFCSPQSDGVMAVPNVNTLSGKDISDYLLARVANDDGGRLAGMRYCAAYTGGGFNDWFLPGTWELELLYRNLKPTTANNNTATGANVYSVPAGSNYTATAPAQTPAALFQSGGAQALVSSAGTQYMSSTFDRAGSTVQLRSSETGALTNGSFLTNYMVRPMRKVAIAA